MSCETREQEQEEEEEEEGDDDSTAEAEACSVSGKLLGGGYSPSLGRSLDRTRCPVDSLSWLQSCFSLGLRVIVVLPLLLLLLPGLRGKNRCTEEDFHS